METRHGDTETDEGKMMDYLFSEELHELDDDVSKVIALEDERQFRKIILIASESMCPLPVRMALATSFVNIYAEGYPSNRLIRETTDRLPDMALQLSYLRRYSDRRYYKGVEYVDFIEALAQRRAARVFATEKTRAEDIFVNVQPLSGAAANNAVYEAFLKPGDTVMGMDLTHGGHLTHGSHANRSGKNYTIIPYHANYETGEIDYGELSSQALKHCPKMIIAGYSAYPRVIDWARLKEIAGSVGAILLADIAHPAGLVVAGSFPSPVDYADVISFTTHKTLCGPRGAAIITTCEEYAQKVDNAVFPGEQGGPHVNSIAAKAVLFKIAATEKFRSLQRQVLENSRKMAGTFKALGAKLAYGGTDSHMCLLDLRDIKGPYGFNLRGEVASRILDMCGITCNKNTIPGDTNAVHPGALRFGTTWITQRGFKENDVERLATLIYEAISAMKPFRYIETQGDVARAKVPLKVMEETARGVQDLIRSVNGDSSLPRRHYPYYSPLDGRAWEWETPLLGLHRAEKARIESFNGCALPLYYKDPGEAAGWNDRTSLIDGSDSLLIEIQGERSTFFLEELTTGTIVTLAPFQSIQTLLLESEGAVTDDVTVTRLPGEGEETRYIVKTNAVNSKKVLTLLRALSDGYIIYDSKELYGKIQGPVVVESLRDCNESSKHLMVLSLLGSDALKALESCGLAAVFPEGRHCVEVQAGSFKVLVNKIQAGGTLAGCDLLVHPRHAESLWKLIIEKGGKIGPAGLVVREKARAEHGLPDYRAAVKAQDLYQSVLKESFTITKPYFVGQKHLAAGLDLASSKTHFEFSGGESGSPLQRTSLYDEHKKLTKKIVPFAGYEMPVWYTSINEEHRAVRETAGLFDVAHMGVLEISGPNATRFLDLVTTNYVPKLLPGQSHYSYVLDSRGDILDDVMLYRRGQDLYMLIVNAVNAAKIDAWLTGIIEGKYILDDEIPVKSLNFGVSLRNLKDPGHGDACRVDMALQGPNSLLTILQLVNDERDRKRLKRLKRNEFIETAIDGMPVMISRTGYTGEELGFEFYLHPDNAPRLWNMILKEGRDYGVMPAGLGARDSTRTEAGLPLYGHELAGSNNITPHEAGYGSFVKFHKPFFVGRAAIIEKEAKREREIIRFRMQGKGLKIVKPGDLVVTKRGDAIGAVTSCVIIEGVQIGLASVKKRYAQPNTRVAVFILPRDKAEEKQKHEIQPGDKVLLHEEALILTRFPAQGELDRDEALSDRE
ncbi:MAG: glycine cleavage system aminomethyltransferase GcvT [Candidatus Eremiobacteraeota bacterium]|nr:glycine cleavage system aminomethyltransferase GcvT [Candidatus Eremiobacteraeota bacterium]